MARKSAEVKKEWDVKISDGKKKSQSQARKKAAMRRVVMRKSDLHNESEVSVNFHTFNWTIGLYEVLTAMFEFQSQYKTHIWMVHMKMKIRLFFYGLIFHVFFANNGD